MKTIKRSLYNYFYMTFGLAWLILVMGVPRAYSNIKILGLIFITCIALTEIVVKRLKINYKYVVVTLFFISICIVSLFSGVLSGYKFERDDYDLIQYYVVIPICALILGMIFYNEVRIKALKKVLICIAFGISLYNLLYLLAYKNIIPQFSILNFGVLASNDLYGNKLILRMSNEPALMFLIPFLIISLYDLKSYEKKYRIIVYFGVIFGCIYAALSGRKALEAVILICFIYLVWLFIKSRNAKKYIKFLFAGLILIIIVGYMLSKMSDVLELENIFKSISNTFSSGLSSNDYGIIKRQENSRALMKGWLHSPFTVLFGHGLNSYARNSIASNTTLWSYEVYYQAFLFQNGLVGIGTLITTIIGIIRKLNMKIKTESDSNDYRAIKIAFICIILASSTNPLIFNVWLWVIVVAFIL